MAATDRWARRARLLARVEAAKRIAEAEVPVVRDNRPRVLDILQTDEWGHLHLYLGRGSRPATP